ncbi:hypothetical protein MVES1_002619 [Malassezia vespertilionis]|uniref:uncharacterized protein n=1 Tax=Malassezia vespertilionis TaxID=2020962 RepID=UPI0024B114E9|nr:uncharacterized protein MVES1_002619 [Malassezia vespertilionis]WFD07259.1 hypothetical protein MVES1_002619 [Malassezia vespertilionis]
MVGPAWDYILKFIIIGDTSVGKSSLLVRLTEDRFLVDSDTTIGIEFGSHIVELGSGERLKLQIWDTAGSEQFRSVPGCLIVFDVTERATFEHIPVWLRDVREQAQENVSIALVGNMTDCATDERAVSLAEAMGFANEHGCVRATADSRLLYRETSAKTGEVRAAAI